MIVLDISVSLDGYVAGPKATLADPLGEGGMLLHEWVFGLASWRAQHGLEGGEHGPDDDVVREWLGQAGAVVMGRRMFSGGSGPWADDPNANGWWGDDPPFGTPVYVVTHHAREPLALGSTTFHFVTDGVEQAVAAARAAAGEKPIGISGGASIAQQCLAAGLLDRIRLHVAPVLLGAGVRLFDGQQASFELERVRASPAVAHVDYRVA